MEAKNILILGINGFIGSHLAERLLDETPHRIWGLDRDNRSISRFLSHPRLEFFAGEMQEAEIWFEEVLPRMDIVLPLAAIATPKAYVEQPLNVFELDFEENLRWIRQCARYRKRVIFPSTSEIYGMCADPQFEEYSSNSVVGPVTKSRWIYSVSKQLLDRLIIAHGERDKMPWTIFRPFNWIGPGLDSFEAAKTGSARAITQMIYQLIIGHPIRLVDGGLQRRTFLDIDDGIAALLLIINDPNQTCNQEIFNIGSPTQEYSLLEFAEQLIDVFSAHPLAHRFQKPAQLSIVSGSAYYGSGYQDVIHRSPSIQRIQRILGWKPERSLTETLTRTVDYWIRQAVERGL